MFNIGAFGKNGLRPFIGQIPPCQIENRTNQNGWGHRFQVRIQNIHPSEGSLLPDKDLPWATSLIPPSHGHGNKGSCGLSGGETVFGVFLDDDCQYPLIIGSLPKTNPEVQITLQEIAAQQSTGFKQANIFNDCNPAAPHNYGDSSPQTPAGQKTPLNPGENVIKNAVPKNTAVK